MFVEEPDDSGVRYLQLVELLVHHLHGMMLDVGRMILPCRGGDSRRHELLSLLRRGTSGQMEHTHREAMQHDVVLTVSLRDVHVLDRRLTLTQIELFLNLLGVGEDAERHKLKGVLLACSLRSWHGATSLADDLRVTLEVRTLELHGIEPTIGLVELDDSLHHIELRESLEDQASFQCDSLLHVLDGRGNLRIVLLLEVGYRNAAPHSGRHVTMRDLRLPRYLHDLLTQAGEERLNLCGHLETLNRLRRWNIRNVDIAKDAARLGYDLTLDLLLGRHAPHRVRHVVLRFDEL